MNNLLSNFSDIISNNIWIALAMALIAGLASSFSPCALSSVPLIVGYVEGTNIKDKNYAFKTSIVFSLGVIFTFTLIGAASAILGKFFSGAGRWWYIMLSIIMLGSGLQLLGVITLGKNKNSCRIPNTKGGLLGAFFLGVLGGILSSPCATPVLAAILTFVAGKANLVLGILMLFLYSVGHCALLVIAGSSVGFVEHLGSSSKTLKLGKIFRTILGVMIILLGFYLFSIGI